MTKILVINTPGLENRGSMAIVIGLINCLRETIPKSQITFLCHHYKTDQVLFEKIINSLNIEVKEHPWYQQDGIKLSNIAYSGILGIFYLLYCAFCGFFSNLNLPFKTIYQKHDIIIDLNSDSLNDHYNKFSALFVLFNIFCATLSRKPIAVCATGIGPFRNRTYKSLTRFILNRVNLITVREKNALDFLRNLDISEPKVHLTADLAFLMEPISQDHVDELLENAGISKKDTLVGVTVPSKRVKHPHQLIADISNLIIENFDAKVLLIPHIPSEEVVLQEVYQMIDKKENVRTIKLLMADELKGIFAACDLFISLKFHPLLGAISVATPSIGIVTYGHYKFYGTFDKMMGLGEYLIDESKIRDTLLNEIKSKTEYVWRNKVQISKELQQKDKYMKDLALLNGKLINELKISKATTK